MQADADRRAPPASFVREVEYVRQFCPELNPTLLRAVAALSGCPAPAGDAFAFAEIGSGMGDTLATLAASYPQATFVGVDVNPAHVAAARDLAARGALANVRFVESDVEATPAAEVPPLDFLAAHGLLAWIPAAKRRALFATAAKHLKAGGLLYLGYNALPGWAGVEPLRRFMLDAAAGAEGTLAARVQHALASAKALADANADYFVANPFAREVLATMLDMGVAYAAHEFFDAHWEPLYFADVAATAAEHDLRFVGQLPLHRNYRDLTTRPALKGALAPIADRRTLERVGGFAGNEAFRRDVYVKGAVARGGDTAHAFLDAVAFGTLAPEAEVSREASLPVGSVRYEGPLFDALIPAVSARAAPIDALAARPALASFGRDAIRHALLRLLMGKDVLPMPRAAEEPSAALPSRVLSAFNRAVLAQPIASRTPVVLASPVAGTGVPLTPLHAVALRALTEAAPADRAAWLRGLVEAAPLRLVDHGRPVTEKEELARHLLAHVEEFRASRLPKLVELGIVGGAVPAGGV
ncbi:MAG TPA: class I SAM-dependent methyltransferase [Polyangiaceae bacterium]|jgi:SAM-dependent methyltransferase|nr:class I SAM-dependent methyltransferase [Polyangiaceae bacterium]